MYSTRRTQGQPIDKGIMMNKYSGIVSVTDIIDTMTLDEIIAEVKEMIKCLPDSSRRSSNERADQRMQLLEKKLAAITDGNERAKRMVAAESLLVVDRQIHEVRYDSDGNIVSGLNA
jgi:hypothetical protein